MKLLLYITITILTTGTMWLSAAGEVYNARVPRSGGGSLVALSLKTGSTNILESLQRSMTRDEWEDRLKKSGDLVYGEMSFIGSPSRMLGIRSNELAQIAGKSVSKAFELSQPAARMIAGEYLLVKCSWGSYALIKLLKIVPNYADIQWVLADEGKDLFSSERIAALVGAPVPSASATDWVVGVTELRSFSASTNATGFLFDGQKEVPIPTKVFRLVNLLRNKEKLTEAILKETDDLSEDFMAFVSQKCDLAYGSLSATGDGNGELYFEPGAAVVLGMGRLMDYAGTDLAPKIEDNVARSGSVREPQSGMVILVRSRTDCYVLMRIEKVNRELLSVRWIYRLDGLATFPKVDPRPGEIPLSQPKRPGSEDRSCELVSFIQSCGDLSDADIRDRVNRLIEAGADVNFKTGFSPRALYVAVEAAKTNVVKILIESGAKPSGPVLNRAVETGGYELVKYLLENGADPDYVDVRMMTPLQVATRQKTKDPRVIELLENVGRSRESVLAAVEACDTNGLKRLLAKRPDLSAVDTHGMTPLHVAANRGDAGMVRMLLDSGAKTNSLTTKGRDFETALMLAARRGHKDVVALLLPGSDLNEQGKALYCAWSMNRQEVCRVILEKSTNALALIQTDKSALNSVFFFSESSNVVQMFEAKGAKIPFGATVLWGRLAEFKAYLDGGVDINQIVVGSSCAGTALHVAMKYGRDEMVELLLAKGADVNKTYVTEDSALHIAIEKKRPDWVTALIARKADVNRKNIGGVTPLAKAVESDQVEVARILLEKGADPNLLPNLNNEIEDHQRTLVERAKSKEMKALLEKHMKK